MQRLYARRGRRLPALAARRAAGHRPGPAHWRRGRAHRGRQGAVLRARLQDRGGPIRGQARLLPRLLGNAQSRLLRAQRDQGQARSASAASSRCTPTIARRSTRSTRATSPPPSASRTPTPAIRSRDPDHPIILESMTFPEPVIEVAIEPKTKADQDKLAIALQRLAEEDPTFRVHDRPGDRADPHRGHGRAAPRDPRRPHGARVQRRRQRRQAAGRLSRDHPARPPRATAGSSARPAAAASTATPSSSSSPARRAAASSSSTRSSAAPSRASTSRRSRRASARRSRPASYAGYPDGRRQGHAVRRLVPRGRLVGDGLQDRRLDGPQGRRREGRPGHPRADHAGRGDHARGVHGRRHRRPQQPPRSHRGHGQPRTARRWSGHSCPWPRCSAMSRTCAA